MPAPSIWASIEIDAISRNFDYANYLSMHTSSGSPAAVLCEEAYRLVRDAFHWQMLNDPDFKPYDGSPGEL
jgi:hypothetical protein